MNPTLRTAIHDDGAAIASWVPDAHACLRWAGPRVAFPLTATEFHRLLAVADSASYCLVDPAQRALGFGQHFVVEPGAVHLGRIIVSPTDRGTGAGRALCELLLARAIRTTGAGTVTLRVYRDNAVAMKLYTRLGFVPVESRSSPEVLFMHKPVPMATSTTSIHDPLQAPRSSRNGVTR